MQSLACTGRSGVQQTFDYRVSYEALSGGFWVRVYSRPMPANGDSFELFLAELDSNTLRVTMAHHHGRPEYVAMGIPEAILPVLKRELGKSIVSSPTSAPGGVYRTPAATKYWNRLCSISAASYDTDSDVYTVI